MDNKKLTCLESAIGGFQELKDRLARSNESEAASEFYEACQAANAPLTITEVHELHCLRVKFTDVSLTPAQREALLLTNERGYFALPRETALADLAEELSVSDQTVSERLRRAYAHLVRAVAATDLEYERTAGGNDTARSRTDS